MIAPSTTPAEDESNAVTRTLSPTVTLPVPGSEPTGTEPTSPAQPSGASMMTAAGGLVVVGVAICFGM